MPAMSPMTGSEPKTDPRIKVHFAELKEQIRGYHDKLEQHLEQDEREFKSLASKFVSHKWLVGLLGGALTVGMALAGWVVKTSDRHMADVQRNVTALVAAHEDEHKTEIQAVKQQTDSLAKGVDQTNAQLGKIYEAIVEGRVNLSPRRSH